MQKLVLEIRELGHKINESVPQSHTMADTAACHLGSMFFFLDSNP